VKRELSTTGRSEFKQEESRNLAVFERWRALRLTSSSYGSVNLPERALHTTVSGNTRTASEIRGCEKAREVGREGRRQRHCDTASE